MQVTGGVGAQEVSSQAVSFCGAPNGPLGQVVVSRRNFVPPNVHTSLVVTVEASVHVGVGATHFSPSKTNPLEHPHAFPSRPSIWFDGQVFWMQAGLPCTSWVSDVPQGQIGSSSTQCAIPVPCSDHLRPAAHAETTGVEAHAPGVKRQRDSGDKIPLPKVGEALHPLMSKSADSLVSPPGQVFVNVLYFEPCIPGPHEVTVFCMGML